MNRIKLLVLCLAVAGLAGCAKTSVAPVDASNDNGTPQLPTQAQPKLATIKLYVGPETLDAEMALTPKQEETGMMYRTNLQDSDSMIFVLPYPMQASFWMYHCPESISAAYITPDGVIAEIHHLEQMDTNAVFSATSNILYVLETSDGWFTRHHVTTGMAIQTEHGSLADTFTRH
jgi:uncharacterized membrane protein (UPF0127 family)